MQNEKNYKQIFSKVHLQDAKKILPSLFIGARSLNLIGIFLEQLDINKNMSNKTLAAGFLLDTAFLSTTIIYQLKFIDIKEPYNDVLENFKRLTDDLDLKNPVEMYTLFCLMYSQGYLSNNKMFCYSQNYDLMKNIGSCVVDGFSLCRHISSMLSDIYNKSENIYSVPLFAVCDDSSEFPTPLDIIKNNSNSTYAQDQNSIIYKKIIDFFSHKIGNHAIVTCKYNNEYYFFDPTNFTFLNIEDFQSKLFLGNGLTCQLINVNLISKKQRNIYNNLSNINIHRFTDQDNYDVKKTILTFNQNKDLIEDFFNENKAAYEYISRCYRKQRNRV